MKTSFNPQEKISFTVSPTDDNKKLGAVALDKGQVRKEGEHEAILASPKLGLTFDADKQIIVVEIADGLPLENMSSYWR